jgi:hypothetical protein
MESGMKHPLLSRLLRRWARKNAGALVALGLGACGGPNDPELGMDEHSLLHVCPVGQSCSWVTNTASNGVGSLAAAIYGANLDPDLTHINFDIPGAGPHVIAVPFNLVATQPIEIRGYVQPGSTRATATTPAAPKIVLDGSNTTDRGLTLEGDDSLVEGLVVQRFAISGIQLTGDDSAVKGCFVGTDANGTGALGNGAGIAVNFGHRAQIGGELPADRNVISGNDVGVFIFADSTDVEGNYIGTDKTGTLDLGNDVGIEISGGTGASIGGDTVEKRNLISGNGTGVSIVGSDNRVEGNLIGTDKNGTAAIPNIDGVEIQPGSFDNMIGGVDGAGNVISGNTLGFGVLVFGDENVVAGNKIGTDINGLAALPNNIGVQVMGHENYVGTYIEGSGNVISGNATDGLVIRPLTAPLPTEGNYVQGNLIGVDATGNTALGNGGHGVLVRDASYQMIGGTDEGAGNTIGGNGGDGIFVETVAANSGVANAIAGNHIGNGAPALLSLANDGSGVRVVGGTSTWIGGPLLGQGNRIAYNLSDGVTIESGLGHAVLGNSIVGNGGLGIDLGPDGVTANDGLGDPDTGANRLQNFPRITNVVASGGALTVSWELQALPNIDVRIELFSSRFCDVSGNGEADRFQASAAATTDATGYASGTIAIPVSPGAGHQLAATATQIGFGLIRNTSELSRCVKVP